MLLCKCWMTLVINCHFSQSHDIPILRSWLAFNDCPQVTKKGLIAGLIFSLNKASE